MKVVRIREVMILPGVGSDTLNSDLAVIYAPRQGELFLGFSLPVFTP